MVNENDTGVERMAVGEARVEALKTRMTDLERRLASVESQPASQTTASAASAGAPPPSLPVFPRAVTGAQPARRAALPLGLRLGHGPRSAVPRRPQAASLEDLLGGRVLGWVGALAVLTGLLFFLAIAASRGWIDEPVRTALAAAASAALLLTGVWLHERRGRTEAALAATAAALAGLFATAVVAGPVYALVPTLAALGGALAVGALATGLALRWAAPGIAWLGILGVLASPVLVGADGGAAGVALMLAAYAAAGAVLLWQRWHALAFTAFLVAVPQLALWLFDAGTERVPTIPLALALTVFGAVTAVGAAGFEWRSGSARLRPTAAALLALNALALAGLGAWGFEQTGAHVWLGGLAVVHLAAGLLIRRSGRVTRELSLVMAGLGIVLADVTFAALADGLPLVLGWAAGAVAFSALARSARHVADEIVALAGLGGHLLLAVAVALTGAAPIAAVGGADDPAAALTAVALIATGAWTAARLLAARRPQLRLGLDALALAALALFSAVALDGAALTAALAGEAVALAAVHRRTGDLLARPAAAAFLALGAGHALAVLAFPIALVDGLAAALPAALGLGALIAALLLVARHDPERPKLIAAAAVLGLYEASVQLVTPFGVEQGQTLLSVLWALTGVLALIAGLARDVGPLRHGALALLGLTVAKVSLFDLASLDSLYRVGSCVALGLLLLAGAYAWQRLRPRAPADLRTVPTGMR